MLEITCHWLLETFKNFREDMTGRSVSGQERGKWNLKMIFYSDLLVHVVGQLVVILT